jgi:hypothetical protein
VRVLEADDYPWGMSLEARRQVAGWNRVAWGEGVLSGLTPSFRGPGVIPSFRHDAEAHRWLARYERAGCSRGRMAAWWSEWEFELVATLKCAYRALTAWPEGGLEAPSESVHSVIKAIDPYGFGLHSPPLVWRIRPVLNYL